MFYCFLYISGGGVTGSAMFYCFCTFQEEVSQDCHVLLFLYISGGGGVSGSAMFYCFCTFQEEEEVSQDLPCSIVFVHFRRKSCHRICHVLLFLYISGGRVVTGSAMFYCFCTFQEEEVSQDLPCSIVFVHFRRRSCHRICHVLLFLYISGGGGVTGSAMFYCFCTFQEEEVSQDLPCSIVFVHFRRRRRCHRICHVLLFLYISGGGGGVTGSAMFYCFCTFQEEEVSQDCHVLLFFCTFQEEEEVSQDLPCSIVFVHFRRRRCHRICHVLLFLYISGGGGVTGSAMFCCICTFQEEELSQDLPCSVVFCTFQEEEVSQDLLTFHEVINHMQEQEEQVLDEHHNLIQVSLALTTTLPFTTCILNLSLDHIEVLTLLPNLICELDI